MFIYNFLTETWFEMSPRQKVLHEKISTLYSKIRHDYHALHSSLWFSFDNYPNSIGERYLNKDEIFY